MSSAMRSDDDNDDIVVQMSEKTILKKEWTNQSLSSQHAAHRERQKSTATITAEATVGVRPNGARALR